MVDERTQGVSFRPWVLHAACPPCAHVCVLVRIRSTAQGTVPVMQPRSWSVCRPWPRRLRTLHAGPLFAAPCSACSTDWYAGLCTFSYANVPMPLHFCMWDTVLGQRADGVSWLPCVCVHAAVAYLGMFSLSLVCVCSPCQVIRGWKSWLVFSMRHGRDMEADLEQQLKEKEGDEDAMREHLQVGSLTVSIPQARG